MNYKIEKFTKFSDKRGDLIVFLKNSELKKTQKKFGQIYFVTFSNKGVVRGNHYHKKWREWFGIVHGKLEVALKDMITGEKTNFVLDSDQDKYLRLEIGPNIAHAFKSISETAALLNYANSPWSNDDDFEEIIIPPKK